ncbi:MAG: M23 family metallopeptidase [Rhodospirillales bacterium]|jgi:murein DD-endopeptidase MepM/ murein hydrolase activator NlpD|nr:M23 family metallopeptidase [Rhodospirillales bacterium]
MNVAGLVRVLLASAAISGLIGASGCGWAEWPPPDHAPRLANRPAASPAGGPSDSLFVGASAVVVAKGDTVYEIAKRHRVPMRAIIEANRLRPPYVLHVGQRIVLPRNLVHDVVTGDTLYGISRRYGVDSFALARANGLQDPYTIRVGQRIVVPTAGRAPAQAAGATAAPNTAAKPDAAAPGPTAGRQTPKEPEPSPHPPGGNGFLWPVNGNVVSAFGPKAKGLHNDGINIAAPLGSAVKAAAGGSVAYAGNELRGFGKLLLIKHLDGWITAYAHNDELLVRPGDEVRKGQPIARVGTTGNVVSPQLHFELRRGKTAVDPEKHLRGGSV